MTKQFIDTSHIIPFDFYDELLIKYYGKYYEYVYTGDEGEGGSTVILGVYVWNDKYYLSKVEVIDD